ncbi:MAG: hypothetical protein IT385_10455, partial [Deltaproteobacteria bacterium]|nr:hypothetical protein [Deltaproteobacteria bacterium]
MKEKLDKGYVTIATDPDPEPDPEPEPEAPKAKGAKKAKAPKKAPAPDPAPAPEPAPEPAPDAADPEGWVEAEDGYALRLVDGALVCRNDKGKVLASVP